MTVDHLVTSFLERYGTALSAGDTDAVAACWEVPALVISDQGVIPVQSEAEIRDFFRSAVGMYRSRGLDSVHAISHRTSRLTPRIINAEVRWSAQDQDGVERHREQSTYLLRIDDAGQPRICVAVTILGMEDEENLVRAPAWAEGL